MWALAQLLPALAFWFMRYLIVVPRLLFAAALVVRRRYLILVPRPMPAAPRRYLAVVHRPLPAAPLVEHRRYLIVVPRPMPAAPLVVHRRYMIVAPGRCPRAARCALQMLDRGAQAVARCGSRCAS
jgi:hypothetical protein